jgi:site-specific DNA-cytosine methylase
MGQRLIIYDFFSGTGSSTQAFEDAGHTIIKVELDEYFDAHERDILELTADGLITKYGQPDFI